MARAVSTITGTAISPLFGVCVLGAYTYAKDAGAATAPIFPFTALQLSGYPWPFW